MSNRVTQGEAVVGALQVETHARAASFEVDQEVGTIINGPGVIKWNAVDETVDVGLNNGVTLQLGQEDHVRCANNHGVLIPNGTLVYMSGRDDTQDVPEILPFLGDGSIDPLLIVGVTTQRTSLDSNKSGVVPTGQYQVTLTAGQSFELMWAVSSTNLTISSAASTSWHPEVLGVMVTFNEVNV